MSIWSLGDRIKSRRHELEALGRRATARVLGSRLASWRLGASDADRFRIVPASIRSGDPARIDEIAAGVICHDGRQMKLAGRSPFGAAPPDDAFARFLHGFDWVVDLKTAQRPEATALIRDWTLDWVTCGATAVVAGETDVRRNRLQAMLTSADIILSDRDPDAYARVMGAILDDLYALAADWRGARTRAGALCSLLTVVAGALAIEDQDEILDRFEPMMLQELRAQILGDGGHASRNPADVVDILTELIPLIRTYAYIDRPAPVELNQVRRRMQVFLRTMRMGDLGFARFNGADRASGIDRLATIARLEPSCVPLGHAAASGYVRCEAGRTVLIADIGTAPPADLSCAAHAGCLSLEVSDGTQLVLVNCGSCVEAGAPDGAGAHALARATASSNTLSLAHASSGRLSRAASRTAGAGNGRLELHGPPVGQAQVFLEDGRPSGFSASHDGYVELYGLRHRRTVRISPDGRAIRGIDELVPADRIVRLGSDLPFAIHFHVHSGVGLTTTGNPNELRIVLPQGRTWRFGCTGAQMYVEESARFDGRRQASSARQVVLRGACAGDSTVAWTLAAEGPEVRAPAASGVVSGADSGTGVSSEAAASEDEA